jgi:hypothetical protein
MPATNEPGSTDSAHAIRSFASVAATLPGLAALLLGLLYALGALLEMADLRGAGLRVGDSLPLLPVTDLLSRGIGVAVGAGVALLGLAGFALSYRRYYDAPAESTIEMVWWFAGMWLVAVALTLAIYFLPLVLGVGILLGVAVCMVLDMRSSNPGGKELACAFAVVVLAFAVHAVVAPRPLPGTNVRLKTGGTVSGSLITSANNRWALEAPRGRIRVIADDEVRAVQITSRMPARLHRALRNVLGLAWWIPLPLVVGLAALVTVRGFKDLATIKRHSRVQNGETGETPS